MDTRRARFLRQALDAVLDILFGDHHQIGKFVDDEHDLRQPLFLGKKARIIFVDLADERSLSSLFFKERITALHFGDRPVENGDNFGRLVDDLVDHQVRQFIVYIEFDLFGVYKYYAQFLGTVFIQKADDQRIEADALTRAGGAGNEKVFHLGDIARDRAPFDVLSHAEHERRRLGVGKFG